MLKSLIVFLVLVVSIALVATTVAISWAPPDRPIDPVIISAYIGAIGAIIAALIAAISRILSKSNPKQILQPRVMIIILIIPSILMLIGIVPNIKMIGMHGGLSLEVKRAKDHTVTVNWSGDWKTENAYLVQRAGDRYYAPKSIVDKKGEDQITFADGIQAIAIIRIEPPCPPIEDFTSGFQLRQGRDQLVMEKPVP